MSETKEYTSVHSCADLDAAIANYLAMQSAVADSAASSEAAGSSAAAAATSAANAADSVTQCQEITQLSKGYFATPEALRAAYPDASGQVGWWAIVGSTDTIWVWDDGNAAWKDSGNSTDLSDYYTCEQADAKFCGKADLSAEVARAKAAEASAQQLTAPIEASATSSQAYAVGAYFVYNGLLYKATATIAQGGTITPGTNCAATTTGGELVALNQALVVSTGTTNIPEITYGKCGKVVSVHINNKPSGSGNLTGLPTPMGYTVGLLITGSTITGSVQYYQGAWGHAGYGYGSFSYVSND